MKALILGLILLLPGCTVLERVGDYIDENPVLVNIATNQVVSRWIISAGDIEAQEVRAKDVQFRIEKVLNYIEGNPTTTVDNILSVIDKNIDWDKLTRSDRLLVTDIVFLISAELEKYETKKLSVDARFVLKTILEAAIHTASIYTLR